MEQHACSLLGPKLFWKALHGVVYLQHPYKTLKSFYPRHASSLPIRGVVASGKAQDKQREAQIRIGAYPHLDKERV